VLTRIRLVPTSESAAALHAAKAHKALRLIAPIVAQVSNMPRRIGLTTSLYFLLLLGPSIAFLALPRFGHATTLVQDANSPSAGSEHPGGPAAPFGDKSSEELRLQLDRQKFDFDRDLEARKLDIERQKLAAQAESIGIERSKTRWVLWTTLTPLIGVLITVGLGIFTLQRQLGAQSEALRQQLAAQSQTLQAQLNAQSEAQRRNEQLSFDVKAAEIIFASKTPGGVQNRGRALQAIFGARLGTSFLSSFDPDTAGGNKEPPEEKRHLLELLLKYSDERAAVLDLWSRLFPGDEPWLQRIAASPLLNEHCGSPQAQQPPASAPGVGPAGTSP
jgi:hypothetical protein